MIRILLVDDQPLFVESLRLSLESYTDDLEIIGIAKDGPPAIEMARELGPDVILMDVHLPTLNGVEAARRILQESPNVQIIMLSAYDEDEYIREALKDGTRGYLLKDI